MATPNVKTRSANRVLVKFDGKIVGVVVGLTASDNYSPSPVLGIGDIHPLENVPTVAQHDLTAEAVLMRKDNLRAAGIISENGDAALEGLVWDLEIYSKDEGQLLRKYMGVSMGSCETQIRANQVIMQNVRMVALDASGIGA